MKKSPARTDSRPGRGPRAVPLVDIGEGNGRSIPVGFQDEPTEVAGEPRERDYRGRPVEMPLAEGAPWRILRDLTGDDVHSSAFDSVAKNLKDHR